MAQGYFVNDGAQLYLIIQMLYFKYLKRVGNSEKIISWKCKGLSTKIPITPTTYYFISSMVQRFKFLFNI